MLETQMLKFNRTYRIGFVPRVYNGDGFPKLIRCEVVCDFCGHDTITDIIAWGPFSGLRRYTFL